MAFKAFVLVASGATLLVIAFFAYRSLAEDERDFIGPHDEDGD